MRIVKVNYLKEYKLEVFFFNGNSTVFDFEPFLQKSGHKSIRKFLDLNKFKKVEIETGFLSWNNGEMEISGEWILNETIKSQQFIAEKSLL